MTDNTDDYRLATKTWEDAEVAFEAADYVVLPCGSTEQHSTHLPTSVDTLRAKHLTYELAEAAPGHDLDLLVLPPLPYGYSEHHLPFSGTITLDADTYRDAIVDVGQSVKEHGGKRFLITNFHAGNIEPHKLAIDRLQRDHGLRTHYVNWTDFARDELEAEFGDDWGHAGEHETSVIEHYRPELVRTENKRPQTMKENGDTTQQRYFDDLTVEGGLGDPSKSNPEFVESVIEHTTDRILRKLASDLDR
ncbi:MULTISPECIES: creatininase family protein [Halorussus]|uniref:creatininase family protein n=1 Tax=Halorussus TaxID=1070314 RepID=UPI0020A1CCDF|nr:creatininase family protein [Halorussus vallis]USZ74974.1 creatininase family protein [Halorussus vallis]